MNDTLITRGYVVVDNFFTDIQSEYYMSQVANSISEKEMLLGQNRPSLVSDINNSKLRW